MTPQSPSNGPPAEGGARTKDGCPDETVLSALLQGVLEEAQRSRVLAHVEGCHECQWAISLGEDAAPIRLELHADALLEPGARLSRYIVRERLGSGAMGVVFSAYDPELDRLVALKLLRAEYDRPELQRHLLLEGQALARLSHPNVVAVHDVGTHGEEIFLAMELVEPPTLAGWLEAPHPSGEVLRMFLDAGRGLAAAHAAGLVHRDFKPANVLVGSAGRARVTDFGMAVGTRSGMVFGTPAYLAPEVFAGEPATALADQFSFCVALYEALYGVRPFAGDTLESLAQSASAGILVPPARDVRLPPALRRALLRGLRARPQERFPSMDALLSELAPGPRRARGLFVFAVASTALIAGGVAAAFADGREARCEAEAGRMGAVWGASRKDRIRTAFLATGAPTAASAWESVASSLDAYATRWRELRGEACLADSADAPDAQYSRGWQTSACLDTRLVELDAITRLLETPDLQLVERAPQMAASLDGLGSCRLPTLERRPQPPDEMRRRVSEVRHKLAGVLAELAAGHHATGIARAEPLALESEAIGFRPLHAEVLLALGQLLMRHGRPEDAETTLYRALWAAEAGRDDELAARAWNLLLSVVGNELARTTEAERIMQHAKAAVERLGPRPSPAVVVDFHYWMAVVYLQQGRHELAEQEVTRGLALANSTADVEPLRAAELLHQLGRIRYRQRRYEKALELHRQAVAARARLLGGQHPSLAVGLSSIASDLDELGRRAEGAAALRQALTLQENAQVPAPSLRAGILGNLGRNLRDSGDHEGAQGMLQRAVAAQEAVHGPDHPRTVLAVSALALVLQDAGELEEALRLCTRAVESLQRTLGTRSARLALPLQYRASVHTEAGRFEEARGDLLTALELLEAEHGIESVQNAAPLRQLGTVALEAGNPAEALRPCERALELDERTQGPDAGDVARDLACLGETWLALGEPAKAQVLLERARHIYGEKQRDPETSAWSTFLLARALIDQGSPDDRERAIVLGDEARGRLEALGLRGRRLLAKVTAWQRRMELQ